MYGNRCFSMAFALALAAAAVSIRPGSNAAAAPGTQDEYLREVASRTARTAQEMLGRATVAGAGDLTLQVYPAQETWPLFAPVTLFVRLANAATHSVRGYFQLNEGSGRLFMYVARSGRDFVPVLSQTALVAQMEDTVFSHGVLPPGGAITARVTLLYDHVTRDYAFPLAGTYRTKAVFAYDLGYKNLVPSDVAEVKVVTPDPQDAEATGLIEGLEQAKVLQRDSADLGATANLRAVVDACPDSEYALYARTPLSWPLGASYAREAPAADRTLGPRHRAMMEHIIATLGDSKQPAHLRMGAALRLGEQFGHKDAIPALVSVINDEPVPMEVRLAALIALSQIPHESAVERLIQVMEQHSEARLRDRARVQLTHMGVPSGPAWRRVVKERWVPRSAGNATVILDESHETSCVQ